MQSQINYDGLIKEVGKCCLSEKVCTTCTQEKCLIGYCKKNLLTCLKEQDDFITGAIDKIPNFDTKIYDEEYVIDVIGFTLNQCKNCNLYHDEDCIINLTRSALEVILFGEHFEYKGSVLLYLNDISNINQKLAERIHLSYSGKKKLFDK